MPIVFLVLSSIACHDVLAQSPDTLSLPNELKKLSLEELMNVEVTSVSKRPEKLNEVASAIQVITQKDIRNSGAKTLPEALRLAPNLQVAQVNASQWAISARGFNNVLSNKLLVLIDGRTVYTPQYAGVYWDVQNVMLEDVDRIEVISGPGGTMWGANAVNGVINIITKSAKETQGLYAEAATGTTIPSISSNTPDIIKAMGGVTNTMPGLGSIRYGGILRDNVYCRVYGTGYSMGNSIQQTTIPATNGTPAKDAWSVAQGGIRLDWDASPINKVMIQSNAYENSPNPDGLATPLSASGQNVVAKWNNFKSARFDFQIQAYYDHTWRDLKNGVKEDLKTYDIEGQNRFQLGQRHTFNYGFNFRRMDDNVINIPTFVFTPANKTLLLYSVFLQYDVMLVRERLRFTIGSKLEHNSYTHFQHQPNARLTWTPSQTHTIWAAASRAVKNPSRLDREFTSYAAPKFPVFVGTDSFKSETMIAYELGWRLQPVKKLSLSVSSFYNFYDYVRSAEPGPVLGIFPVTFANGVKGETYGVEFSANYQLASWWSLRGGYTLLQKHLWVKDISKDLNKATAESNDPENQFLVQSNITLPAGFDFGTVMRYVDILNDKDILAKPNVPDYMGLDLRIGWKLAKFMELNLVGQNLLQDTHVEYVGDNIPIRRIERSMYGKIICRF